MHTSIRAKLKELFGIDLRSLALFRIGLALVLLGDLYIRFFDLGAHYTDSGVLPREAVIEKLLDPWAFSLHLANGTWQFELILFLIHALCGVALLVGYQTRLATLLCWILTNSLMNRNPSILQGGDDVLKLLLFWSMFLPLGALWSLDSHCKEKQTPLYENQIVSAGTLALLIQVSSIYWFASLLKTDPVWTIDGTAVWYSLSIEQYATSLGKNLLQYPALLKIFSFTSLYLETYGPFFAFFPIWTAPLRIATVITFILFHLIGLNLTMELALFPYICAVAWITFIPGVFWNWLLGFFRNSLYLKSLLIRPCNVPEKAWEASPFSNGLASFFLIYVFFLNLSTLNEYNQKLFVPLQPLGNFLGLDQKWEMFAPYPITEDGWYVIPAILRDGTKLDLYTEKSPVSWEKPNLLSHTYPNDRWRSYLMNLYLENDEMMADYAGYLCAKWNATHPPEKRLERFQIVLMSRINSIQQPEAPYKQKIFWEQACGN